MRILVVTQHFWPENFRINDIVEGFVQDGLSVDVLCGLPNYPKGEWFDGYSADGPFEEVYKGARVFRAREIPRKGNTGKTIFLNYVSWPLYAAGALKRLPGGYDAVFCFNTSPVLMCWPAIRYAKKHHIPFTNYVLDLWPHLLLVGDGMSREALQKQAADLHAGDAVTFYGSVPATDVPRFTALADALLISLSDSPDLGLTVPGKLASYMAAAKPVLASMNGAGYAAVLESGGGLVSPACDQKALADNMLALYRMTDAERAALGAKAKAYYTAHYRRAELLKRLEEFTVKGV